MTIIGEAQDKNARPAAGARGRPGAFRCLVLLVLLLLPSAAAADAQGAFTLEGPLCLPAGSGLELTPLAGLVNRTGPLDALDLTVPQVHVHVYEHRYAEVNAGAHYVRVPLHAASVRETTFTLHNATLGLIEGDHRGFIGIYGSAAARMHVTPTTPAEVQPRESTRLTDRQGRADVDTPDVPWYDQSVEPPHVLLATPGNATYAGPGALKLMGPDVRIRADENVTTHRTGTEVGGPGAQVHRWIYLTFDAGALQVSTPHAPLTVAGTEAGGVTWDGEAAFRPVSGVLETATTRYRPSGGALVTLTGRFTGGLHPVGAEDGSAASLRLEGDVRETTLTAEPVAPAQRSGWFGLGVPLGFLAGAVVGGLAAVGAGAIRHHRDVADATRPGSRAAGPRTARRTRVDANPAPVMRECIERAHRARNERRWGEALEAIQCARRWAPRDADLVFEEAECLLELGQHDLALAAYDTAARMGIEDGQADFYAAGVLADAGRFDEALARLARALERTPELVLAIDRHAFRSLRSRPAFEHVVREAYERVGDRERRGEYGA